MNALQQHIEKWSIPVPECGCWIWLGGLSAGRYGQAYIEGGYQKAHRVSWQGYRGPIPNGLQVLHKCDTPACVNPDHLFLGTQSENMTDMWKKNRASRNPMRGEAHYAARLNEAQVLAIRASHATTKSVGALAEQYGVSRGCIENIVYGRSWKTIKPLAEACVDAVRNAFGIDCEPDENDESIARERGWS